MIAENRTLDAVKTMASAMTHDFNSMLTTIVYSIELALYDIPEETLTYKDLNRVLLTSREAVEHIAKIMSFCKPPKSGINTMDVRSFFNDRVVSIKAKLPSGIDLLTNYSRDIESITADGEQLVQVLDHLIDNAVQSIEPSGGIIHFTASWGSMPDQSDPSMACLILSVTDNGPGIFEETLPQIFDPFFSTKSQGIHKGLGLSIVHSLVENHNGVIHVSSKAHEETRFDIYLPVS